MAWKMKVCASAVVFLLILAGRGWTADQPEGDPTRPGVGRGKADREISDPALKAVEEDQVKSDIGIGGLNDPNLLRGRYRSYAHCSSYRRGSSAVYILDGSLQRGWVLDGTEKSGWVDGSMGLPVTVDKIVVREAGDQIRSFDLKIYDGAEWRSIASGTTLGTKAFRLKPTQASAVRIDITTAGGGGIAEVEVYNTADPDCAFAGGPSPAVRKAFAQGRLALLLGSPYALTDGGKEYINPREDEIRPLPDSSLYLPDVISFLVKKFGGDGKWDAGGRSFAGTCNGKDIRFSMPEVSAVQNGEQVVGVWKNFGVQAGIPCAVHSDFPLLLLFGEPLPASGQPEILKEVRELLGHSPGVLRFGRGPVVEPVTPHAVIKPSPKRIGKTLQWVGARTGGVAEGTNEAAWMSYFRPNAVRTWYGNATFGPYVKLPGEPIADIRAFDRLKESLRADPEKSELILWSKLLNADIHREMQYEYAVYRNLGIEVVNETGPKDWPDDWTNNFRNWLITYAATYYLAKNYDVATHQYGNEPDGYLKDYSDKVIALKLQLVGDAIHCAIEDVNRRYEKRLESKYAAPVLASDPCSKIARVMMRSLRTDYHGGKLDRDLVQFYNRHRYNDRARQNVLEVHRVQKMMLDESATGQALPQIFTELNYSTGGNWAQPHITVTNDSPLVIHCLGSIWGQMMAAQHVYGIFLFKLNGDNTKWSNTVCQKFIKESDTAGAGHNTDRKLKTDIGYTSRNAEVLRLFAEGFAGQQDLLDTEVRCGDMHYQAYTAFNSRNQTYYLWTLQVGGEADYIVELDLSNLDVKPGAPVLVREVSAASFGEVVFNGRLPASRKITLTQPRESVWLVSVPKQGGMAEQNFPAVADATIGQGRSASRNYGAEPTLQVQRHSKPDHNRISFVKFSIGNTKKEDIHRVLLRLYGKRISPYAFDDSYTFRVYVMVDVPWRELELTAENAPGVCRTVSAVRKGVLSFDAPPVGHMSFTGKAGFAEIDVTHFVKEHAGHELTFLLIRELKWPGENTDFGGVELGSREGPQDQAPRLQVIRSTEGR